MRQALAKAASIVRQAAHHGAASELRPGTLCSAIFIKAICDLCSEPDDLQMEVTKSLSPILVVGWYRELTFTRVAMLKSKGFHVIETYDLQEALRVVTNQEVALVVLCQSIPRKPGRILLRAMKHAKPSPVLAFGLGWPEADISLPNLAGPEKLLTCVASILGKSGESPAGDGF
jgi:hypothetical protein